jgi:coenzyme F420-0:L-glutamate ligase/coenzyme F420-1:gamma-L-glutamate ligase
MTLPDLDGPAHLEWLRTRRSVRTFTGAPVPRDVLERLFAAAGTAPSSSNRQPWRFAAVTAAETRARLADAVRRRVAELEAVIQQGHHGADYGAYGDFFWEPLAEATVIIVPQHRVYPDLLGDLVLSGGGDPRAYHTPAEMQAELCSTAAAVMCLLLQARAEGLGAVWMAGPTVGADDIGALLGIAPPWRMTGAIALGWPAAAPPSPPRKAVDKIVTWFD